MARCTVHAVHEVECTVLEAAKAWRLKRCSCSFIVALARSSLCCSGAACEGVGHALISSHLFELGVLSKFLLTPAMVPLSRVGDHRSQANQSVTLFWAGKSDLKWREGI